MGVKKKKKTMEARSGSKVSLIFYRGFTLIDIRYAFKRSLDLCGMNNAWHCN